MNERSTLIIIPALRARRGAGDTMILTRKFVDGLHQYAQRWPGPVTAWVGLNEEADTNLDHIEVAPDQGQLSLRWLSQDNAELDETLSGARFVLVSLVDEHLHLAERCTCRGIPLAFVSEYTLRTRCQIIRSETSNPLLRLRRELWTKGMERRIVHALHHAAGIQCNGTPTYEAYHRLTPRPLLYFDSRVGDSMLASDGDLAARTAELMGGSPLRLAFSGRLIAMKGPDHLPRVAAELKRLGVPFRMDICGAGALEDDIAAGIRKYDLSDVVTLNGVLEFHNELMPFVARNVDLFVCCHRQGDPSCSYLETMACGTPIVGYDNEAFTGVVGASGVGWLSPMDDPEQLAVIIAEINRDRSALVEAAAKARIFAAGHTFDKTMDARVDHMLDCCRQLESDLQRCRNSA